MKQIYPRALKDVLVYEGRWADHPKDPGGAIMKGVTIAVYRAFKGSAVTKAELRAIWRDVMRGAAADHDAHLAIPPA